MKGVRDYVLRKLQEIAKMYDFDGIELDFSRFGPMLTESHAWELRS